MYATFEICQIHHDKYKIELHGSINQNAGFSVGDEVVFWIVKWLILLQLYVIIGWKGKQKSTRDFLVVNISVATIHFVTSYAIK